MIAATAAVCAGFTYQGVQGWGRPRGIRATITIPNVPDVATGHVAGWVGVNNGGLAWLQAGVHVRAGAGARLYIESNLDTTRRIVEVGPARLGARYPVEILELSPGRWSATVGGRRVTVRLPLEYWTGNATGESYADEGCNRYRFRFAGLRVFDGSGWRRWRSVSVVRDVGRVVRGRDSLVVSG